MRPVPALHFHHVTVQFGEVEVLQDINFNLDKGDFLAIVGPNGAGKSTLIKVVLGLVKPKKGHAALFGRDAGEQPEHIGYVPQLKTFDRSFPATALELVVTGLKRSWPVRISNFEKDKACSALVQVGAERLTKRPLAKLSGGELQRVFLARALVREPEIVLLDEPATGVDFLAEHDLYDLLERYQKGREATLVMITHDLAAARYHASKVAVLNRKLHGFGDPVEVLTQRTLQETFGHLGHEHSLVVT
jgi:zinc transport system ATP-binding protein